MISQISTVSFLVYTLLCVESWSTDSWECGPKTGRVLGDIKGCKNITICKSNGNLPKAAKFQNSIFSPLQMRPPPDCRPGRTPPFPSPLIFCAQLIYRHIPITRNVANVMYYHLRPPDAMPLLITLQFFMRALGPAT